MATHSQSADRSEEVLKDLGLRDVTEKLKGVTGDIRRRFNPVRIILFGSYASGKTRPESDVDLLVVAPVRPNWREAQSFGMELRRNFGLELHLLFMGETEFEETRDVVGGLAFPASRSGKILYETRP